MAERTAIPKLHKGDRVRLRIGSRRLKGVVIEDRGALGAGGKQIVRIRIDDAENTETRTFEVRAEDLEVA